MDNSNLTPHGHNHSHSHLPKSESKLAIAAILTGAFMFVEVVGGLVSGSLALLADAGHMLTDFASLMLAWIAVRLARRPADSQRTYGFDRFSILAAFVNGLSLFAIAAWILYESFKRLTEPVEVLGGLMFWIALIGLLINVVALIVLTRGEGENLNVRAAALHVAGDMLGSLAAVVASIVIIYTGWHPIDPLLSALVTLIILKAAWDVVRESGHILLEGAPKGFDLSHATSEICCIEGVEAVNHIHAWCVTAERPMASLELIISEQQDPQATKAKVKQLFESEFGINHVTIEVVERFDVNC